MGRIDQAAVPGDLPGPSGSQTRPMPTAYDTPNVSPDSRGVGALGGLEGAAVSLGEYVARARDEATVAATLDTETEHEKFKTQQLHAPDTGLFNLQGKAALAQSKPVMDAIEQNRRDLAAKLPTQHARNAFLAKTQGPLAATREAVEVFASKQSDAANDTSFTSNVAEKYDTLSNSYDNATLRESTFHSLAQVAQARGVVLQNRGVPEEAVRRQQHAIIVGGVKAVLDRYLEKEDGIGAQAYLDSGAREALGAEAGDYAKRVQEAAVKQKSDTYAQGIVSESMVAGTPRVDEAAAMAKVNKMESGALKDQTMARVQHFISIGQQVQAQQNASTFSKLMAAWEAQPQGQRNVADLPLTLMQKVDDPRNLMPDKRGLFEQLEREDRAHDFNPTPTGAQMQADGMLMADMVKNPAKYAKQSPEEFQYNNRSLLTGAQFSAAAQRHVAVIASMQGQGNIALPPKVEQLVVKMAKDNNAITHDDPKLMTSKDAITLATIRDAIRVREQMWKASGEGKAKGEAPEAEYVKWIEDEMTRKGTVVGGGIFGSNKNDVPRAKYLATPEYQDKQFVTVEVSQIPKADLAGIDKSLIASGKKTDTANRLTAYKQLLENRKRAAAAPPAVTGGGMP